MEPNRSPHYDEQDPDIMKLLENMESDRVEYPPDLLAARRASFIAQLKQQTTPAEVHQETPARQSFVQQLREAGSVREEYPPELLAARRAAFLAQVEKHTTAEVREEITSGDQVLLKLFTSIKAAEEAAYPAGMLAARRASFRRRIALGGRISLLDALRTSLQRLSLIKFKLPSLRLGDMMRTSVVVALLLTTVYLGSILRTRQPAFEQAPANPGEVIEPVPALATVTPEPEEVICKPGYLPPLCLAKEFNPSQTLTYQGNGVARPAVAKDRMPGYEGINQPAYVNDGLYGPGASWISNSAYSWVKIDLGKPTTINTVTFGRDRLGKLNDRDPGQFVIAVALSDNIYADGNSSNDYIEYTQVYHSLEDGFSGEISGPETVRADFGPITARYVKIIFANEGTAVDEIEVFMVQPPVLAEKPTRKPKDREPSNPPASIPTSTRIPTDTAMPEPTNTPVPTDTSTPRPTNTPRPSNTPTDIPPTNTPRPDPTDTPRPVPTDTPRPEPTNTPMSEPTDTRQPIIAPTEPSVLPTLP